MPQSGRPACSASCQNFRPAGSARITGLRPALQFSRLLRGAPEEKSHGAAQVHRDILKVGTFERDQLRQAAAKSNEVLRQLGPDIQWLESFVAADKTFCVYPANDEAIIRKHAEIRGFPATKITEVPKTIDPTTERPA